MCIYNIYKNIYKNKYIFIYIYIYKCRYSSLEICPLLLSHLPSFNDKYIA